MKMSLSLFPRNAGSSLQIEDVNVAGEASTLKSLLNDHQTIHWCRPVPHYQMWKGRTYELLFLPAPLSHGCGYEITAISEQGSQSQSDDRQTYRWKPIILPVQRTFIFLFFIISDCGLLYSDWIRPLLALFSRLRPSSDQDHMNWKFINGVQINHRDGCPKCTCIDEIKMVRTEEWPTSGIGVMMRYLSIQPGHDSLGDTYPWWLTLLGKCLLDVSQWVKWRILLHFKTTNKQTIFFYRRRFLCDKRDQCRGMIPCGSYHFVCW